MQTFVLVLDSSSRLVCPCQQLFFSFQGPGGIKNRCGCRRILQAESFLIVTRTFRSPTYVYLRVCTPSLIQNERLLVHS